MIRFMTAVGATLVVAAVALPASAQVPERPLREAAFKTCAEAQAMPAEERRALALNFADAAARHYQTQIANDEKVGEELGWLVRSACTMAPEAYLSTVVARAVRVVGGGTEPPLQQPLDMTQAVFASCSGTKALPPEQLKELTTFIATEAATHYGLTPGPEWTSDYVAALVHNVCQMYPDMYYLAIVGHAVRTASEHTETPPQPAQGRR
jgi:hypothetical protein